MSAEVAVEQFSFSCAARLSQQDEVTQRGHVQVKALQLDDFQGNPILSKLSPVAVVGALVQNENQAQGSAELPSGGDVAAAQVLVCARAKRQLSSESAARTITVVKKTTVRKEAEEQKHLKPKAQLGQKTTSSTVAPEKRRRRKDLFTSFEFFHRVDSHVVRAGAEVRPMTLFCTVTHAIPCYRPGKTTAQTSAGGCNGTKSSKNTTELCRKSISSLTAIKP